MSTTKLILLLFLLLYIPFVIAINGIFFNNSTLVVSSLSIGLIFLTTFLVISASRTENYQRRLLDLTKLTVGATITKTIKIPITYFIIEGMPEELKKYTMIADDFTVALDSDKQNLQLSYLLNREEIVESVLEKLTKEEHKKEIKHLLDSFRNL